MTELYILDNEFNWKTSEELEIVNKKFNESESFLQRKNNDSPQIKLPFAFAETIKNVFEYDFSVTATKISIYAKYNAKILTKVSGIHAIFVYNCIKSEIDKLIDFAYEKCNYDLQINLLHDCDETCNYDSLFHKNEGLTEYHILREFAKKYNKNMHNDTIAAIVNYTINLPTKKNNANVTAPMYSPFTNNNYCIYCNQKESILVCQQCCVSEFVCLDCWQQNKDIPCVICRKLINDANSHVCVSGNNCILPFSVNTPKMKATISHNAKIVSNNAKVNTYISSFDKFLNQKNNKLIYDYEAIGVAKSA
jgi:hypothetical protein